MITCPECGLSAPDDAKFCERCGRGLARTEQKTAPATRPIELSSGATLKGGFEITELAGQTSNENRYRARRTAEGKSEAYLLRERFGPDPLHVEEPAPEPEPAPAPAPRPAEDPNGPTAKTAELKPHPAAPNGRPPERAANQPERASATTLLETPAVSESVATESESERAELTPEAQSTLSADAPAGAALTDHVETASDGAEPPTPDDLGEAFGRVMALSMTLNHPAFQRALEGFADRDRVYLVYRDEELKSVSRGGKLTEPEAISAAVQVCQAISFVHRRGLRLNDVCPQSVAIGSDGRLKFTGLEYVSNDNELQSEPIFNDGYTAPEIYKGKKVDKRADIFSAGALLYTWLTGDRIESESWREEAGPIRFYPPHVIAPKLEQAILRALAFDAKDRWSTIDEFKAELTGLLSTVNLRSAALTDVGRVREHNEDAVMAVEYLRESLVDPDREFLYVVADGMGGAEAGEVAAGIAVGAIRRYVEDRLSTLDASDPAALLIAAIEEANRKIIEYQGAHPESRTMGSTAVGSLVTPPNAGVAWVGDSRVYLMENGSLRQLTKDHSLVQRLVEIGQITPEEARSHEHKNVITRSLGARATGPAGAEALNVRLKRGDRLLLCSDGLTTHVEDSAIGEILRRHQDPWEAARELVTAANAGGGTDNVSVIVVYAG